MNNEKSSSNEKTFNKVLIEFHYHDKMSILYTEESSMKESDKDQ